MLIISVLGTIVMSCQKEPEPVNVTAVTLNTSSASLLEDETLTLVATISPSNAGNKKVIWTTSNSSVATVTDGIVKAIKEGTATITAISDDGGKTATCTIEVTSKVVHVTGISLNITEIELTEESEVFLIANVYPENATDKDIVWASNNPDIASVDNGKVTASRAGTATISAITKDSEKVAICNVAVVEKDYFSITSNGNTIVSITKKERPNPVYLEYRKNSMNWAPYAIETEIELFDGERVQFRAGENGNQSFSNAHNSYYSLCVKGDGTVQASGNIMSLLDKTLQKASLDELAFCHFFYDCDRLTAAPSLPAKQLAFSCYESMFEGCTSLVNAPDLPATTLASQCYCRMFSGCISLVDAPTLPATHLEGGCYLYMFNRCTSLKHAPILPATKLANACYYGMFEECSSLIEAPGLPAMQLGLQCYCNMFCLCTSLLYAPALPATTLADHCYSGMFNGCSSLVNVPELPASQLTDRCYFQMFRNCISLIDAPVLSATQLAKDCYREMFGGCSSLMIAPELPALILEDDCYSFMFNRCTSLMDAPLLPATTLAKGCYSGMFGECTSLINVPERLPALQLTEHCYSGMFDSCTSLTSAPELPATELTINCYYGMFWDCYNLSYLKMMATDISADSCVKNLLTNVSRKGIFVKNSAATWSNSQIIPNGWIVYTASK